MFEIKTVLMFSVFSGTFYELPEKDINLMDSGQIPLIKKPKQNCKKCFNKGHIGRDSQNYGFIPCSCVRKVVNFSIIKQGEQKL